MTIKKIKERLDNTRHTYHALREEFNDNVTAKQIEDALKNGFELTFRKVNQIKRSMKMFYNNHGIYT